MSGDLCNSHDAASAFKDTVIELMTGLQPIIRRYDSKGWQLPDAQSLLSGNGLSKIFETGVSPSVKFLFAQSWAKNMDAVAIIQKFNSATKKFWKKIEEGSEKEQEQALLSIIDGLNVSIPGNSDFLRSVYEKKDLLSTKERAAIVEYFKTCCYYGQIYEEYKGLGK